MMPNSPLTSLVSTNSPYAGSAARKAAQMPQAYRSGASFGGNASRDAMARGMADAGRNQNLRQQAEFGQAFQQKAEQARSEDIYNQRNSQLQRYGLSKDKETAQRQQDLQSQQAQMDVAAYMDRAKKDARLRRTEGIMNMIVGGGLLNANASLGLAKSTFGSGFGRMSGAMSGNGAAAGLGGLLD
jgi:flagellar motility protein MotE (MotC chaperone)